MDKYCQHHKIYKNGLNEYHFFTWSIPEISILNNLTISPGSFDIRTADPYYPVLSCDKDKIAFKIESECEKLKCFVSMVIGSRMVLLRKSLNRFTSTPGGNYSYSYSYDLVTLSSQDEAFRILKQNRTDTLDFICKVVYPGGYFSTRSVKANASTSVDNFYGLRALTDVLRKFPVSSLKQKVVLQVGEETLNVSKEVLCSRSPVFAKMFENGMKEALENSVIITDIKMPVLKVLISFLYSGKLPNCDFDMSCDLYYAADKYDIAEVRQICANSIISKITIENLYPVLRFAFEHNDELLKSTVFALIATNIEKWFCTDHWIDLVNDRPMIALEVLQFFDF